MRQQGYTARFWHVSAHQLGVALNQSRLAGAYFKGDELTEDDSKQPKNCELPARAITNLLLPVGIPRKAWHHGAEDEADPLTIRKYFPCLVTHCIDNKPIFESCSPMPDLPNSWIQLERGVRQLQACKLAKAKGMPNTWTSKDLQWELGWKQDSMSLHTWTAAIDSIGEWLDQNPGEGSCET
jgi:hypothetical protein